MARSLVFLSAPATALDPMAILKHVGLQVVKLGDPFQVLPPPPAWRAPAWPQHSAPRLLCPALCACPTTLTCASRHTRPALCASPLYLLACPSTLRLPHHFDLRLPP